MINQDRVREMNKMAILESGVGEKELKISTYRRADFVILQLVKGNKKGMAIVGLITGGIGFAASIILYILIFFTGLGSYSSYNDIYDHIYDDIYDDIEDSMDDGTI